MRPNLGLTLLILLTLLVLIPVYYLRKQAGPFPSAPFPVRLMVRETGQIYLLDLEQYLIGVVAAEMPAEFASEALKAQAIAARTIAVRRMKRFGGQGCQHSSQTDFCDDPAENQAWLSTAMLQKKWGERNFLIYYRKIFQAVHDTAGVIMTFNNRPIDAVFHSTCGVGTASALEVWHHDVFYLQSTSCGFDYQSSHYRSDFQYNWSEMARRLNLPVNNIPKIKITSLSPTGRVLKLSFGQFRMSGDEFRKKLALASTCFSWKATKTGLRFSVIGYGHGVGLCQYGAGGIAATGRRYPDILRHYYRGISFKRIKY